jgi:hypothetical protein
MFELYQDIITRCERLSLDQERDLIARAQNGSSDAKQELLLCQIGFFLYRINTVLYPVLVKQYGEDILQECLLLASEKIYTYNLRYKNKDGKPQQVYFRSYLWKAVTGIIIRTTKRRREISFTDLSVYNVSSFQEMT